MSCIELVIKMALRGQGVFFFVGFLLIPLLSAESNLCSEVEDPEADIITFLDVRVGEPKDPDRIHYPGGSLKRSCRPEPSKSKDEISGVGESSSDGQGQVPGTVGFTNTQVPSPSPGWDKPTQIHVPSGQELLGQDSGWEQNPVDMWGQSINSQRPIQVPGWGEPTKPEVQGHIPPWEQSPTQSPGWEQNPNSPVFTWGQPINPSGPSQTTNPHVPGWEDPTQSPVPAWVLRAASSDHPGLQFAAWLWIHQSPPIQIGQGLQVKPWTGSFPGSRPPWLSSRATRAAPLKSSPPILQNVEADCDEVYQTGIRNPVSRPPCRKPDQTGAPTSVEDLELSRSSHQAILVASQASHSRKFCEYVGFTGRSLPATEYGLPGSVSTQWTSGPSQADQSTANSGQTLINSPLTRSPSGTNENLKRVYPLSSDNSKNIRKFDNKFILGTGNSEETKYSFSSGQQVGNLMSERKWHYEGSMADKLGGFWYLYMLSGRGPITYSWVYSKPQTVTTGFHINPALTTSTYTSTNLDFQHQVKVNESHLPENVSNPLATEQPQASLLLPPQIHRPHLLTGHKPSLIQEVKVQRIRKTGPHLSLYYKPNLKGTYVHRDSTSSSSSLVKPHNQSDSTEKRKIQQSKTASTQAIDKTSVLADQTEVIALSNNTKNSSQSHTKGGHQASSIKTVNIYSTNPVELEKANETKLFNISDPNDHKASQIIVTTSAITKKPETSYSSQDPNISTQKISEFSQTSFTDSGEETNGESLVHQRKKIVKTVKTFIIKS